MARLKAKHPSRPFNPDVANAFFRAGMIEAWGRGIQRILDACRAASVPEPSLRYEPSGLWMEFSIPSGIESAVPDETPVETPVKILQVLKANPTLTLSEVASQIGKSARAVERASAKLVKEGHLRYVGPRKGGHWEVTRDDHA